MTEVKIIAGISGSGKSTLAQNLCAKADKEGKSFRICCADDFFMVEGMYKWDANQLGAAHAECFSKFLKALADGVDLICVANTSLAQSDISPYMLGAAAYCIEAEIVMIECDPELAASRNQHGLTERDIRRQEAKKSRMNLPRYWKVVKYSAEA